MKKENCELLTAGEVLPDPRWRMPPHLHTHHELIVVKSGAMRLKTGRKEILATGGDMLFYKAGLVHEESSMEDDPANTLFIAFRAGELLPSFPLRMRDAERRVAELLSWLVRDRRQGRSAQDCAPLLAAIIREIEWLLARPADPWQEEIRSYLLMNLSKPISLDRIARHAGMSRFGFIRKFKRRTGRTPMEELRMMRLNEARNMILSSGLPLKAIAPAAGIGDEYQLSKLFRRHFGISPTELRTRPGRGARSTEQGAGSRERGAWRIKKQRHENLPLPSAKSQSIKMRT